MKSPGSLKTFAQVNGMMSRMQDVPFKRRPKNWLPNIPNGKFQCAHGMAVGTKPYKGLFMEPLKSCDSSKNLNASVSMHSQIGQQKRFPGRLATSISFIGLKGLSFRV